MNGNDCKLLVCGEIFDVVNTGTYPGAILVKDGRIAWVAQEAELPAKLGVTEGVLPEEATRILGAELVDLSDSFVMPGLIEGHAHIGMDSSLGMERQLLHGGYGEITVRSIRNAQADLLAGFTTVRDECSFAFTDVDVRNMINRDEIWGPRLLVSGMALSSVGGHADLCFRPGLEPFAYPEAHIAYMVNGADEARLAARKVVKYGADVVKLMATGGVLSDDASVGAPDLCYDEMRAACEIAAAHGKISSAHAHGAAGIKNAVRAGVTSIEHASLIDEEGCELVLEAGACIVPTLIAHRSSVEKGRAGRIPRVQYEKALMVEEHAARGIRRLHDMGAKIGFGTDAGTPGNPHGQQMAEFKLMMEQGGFSASEVLRAATVVNAQMLGLEGELGTLSEGKAADIVAFAKSPLKDIEALENCRFVMRSGRVYKQNGRPVFAQAV